MNPIPMSKRPIVCDTTLLLYLGRIDQIQLLSALVPPSPCHPLSPHPPRSIRALALNRPSTFSPLILGPGGGIIGLVVNLHCSTYS